MENAWALLGVHASTDIGEIEEAYRVKKRLYDPARFMEGSPEREFARIRSDALDRAWEYASAIALRRDDGRLGNRLAFRGEDYGENYEGERETRERLDEASIQELVGWLLLCPIVVVFIQWLIPSVLSDAAPAGLRGSVRFAGLTVAVLSCAFPILLRFALFRRPLRKRALLLCFPLSLIAADLVASAILRFSFTLSGREFRYVPALYLWGWGPLLFVLSTHCAILALPREKRASLLGRLASRTFALFLSAALSMAVCVAFNRENAPVAPDSPAASASSNEAAGEKWRSIVLFDAGLMEIPVSWYVDEDDRTNHRFEQGQIVQHTRNVLTARPYGLREQGPDFVLEVLVYRWARRDGRELPPPAEARNRMQERQYEEFTRLFPDVASSDRTRGDRGGRTADVLTAETRSVPGFVVRLRNLIFEEDNRLFSITVSYPVDEEPEWETTLDRVLRRWRIGGER
ncbi:MAG: DUF998 domain-containing protein [Synergistaceae bacterium]|nr:DUF998 domain-containing protein [Synergistaceae bacterium]